MARIKNQVEYPVKPNPHIKDFVVGSDYKRDGKTVSFEIGTLLTDSSGALPDAFISGDYYWIDGTLSFGFNELIYRKNGKLYATVPTTVTLDNGGALPRKDIIAVNIYEEVVVIKGEESATPAEPVVPNTTEFLKFTVIDIPAGATQPDNISLEKVYDENAGEPTEWTATENTGGSRIIIPSADDSNTFSSSIKVIDPNLTGDIITFQNDVTSLANINDRLQFFIKITSEVQVNSGLSISFYNGATKVSDDILLIDGQFSFSAYDTEYQFVSIPLNSFVFSDINYDTIKFEMIGFDGDLKTFYIDTINIASGLGVISGELFHSEITLDDGTNPHGTTKADIGLTNVDNTSDVDKPVSTAQQAALDLKMDIATYDPAGIEEQLVGLTTPQTIESKTLTDTKKIVFDITNAAQPEIGEISWNEDDGTVDIGMAGGNVVLQVGQEVIVYVKANEAISDGDVVYIDGAVGASGKVTVSKFLANRSISQRRTIGLATESIAQNSFGFITIIGNVRGIQTNGVNYGETWVDGEILYASDTVSGGLTKDRPISPNQSIPIGFVIDAKATNGTILVRGTSFGYDLGDLHDVLKQAKVDRDALMWSAPNERWENRPIVEADISDLGSYVTQTEAIPLRETVSTGIVSGGELTINALDDTLFDISAGFGFVVDSTVYPATVTPVSWDAFVGLSVTNLATSFATDVAIDVNGNVLQQNSYTDEEKRSVILLGGLDHSSQVNILSTFSIQVPIASPASSLQELARAIGDLNLSGNVYAPNGANLSIDKSGGTVFSYGRNNVNNENAPHVITTAPDVLISFGKVFNDGAGNGVFTTPTTTIDPDFYDDGSGTLAAVPVNDWQIKRILFFPNDNKTFIQYGTATYNKFSDALNAVPRAVFESLSGITTAVVRGYIIIREGETSLQSADTEFIPADKFGSVGGIDAGGSQVQWGNITGTLSDQIDLQNALDLKEDVANKNVANGYAGLDANGVLFTSQLPNLAITSVVAAAETSLSAFAANSGAYTFEEGDVIVITTVGGDTEHYMYDGGTKTLVGSYSQINNTQVDWSQIVNEPAFAQTKAAISNQWLKSYDASTGLFTSTQPLFSDIGSTPTTLAGYGITDAYTKTEIDSIVLGDLADVNFATSPSTTYDNVFITRTGFNNDDWTWVSSLNLDTVTADTIIKSGGLSTQFLKADGSVDSNTYITLSAADGKYLLNTTDVFEGTLTFNKTSGNLETNWSVDGAGVDEKEWDFVFTTGGALNWRAVNDANLAATNFMTVNRTGIVIDSIQLAGTLIDVNGNLDVSGTINGNGSGLTDVDAETLDSLDSTQFLRSDADDTTGNVRTWFNGAIAGQSASGSRIQVNGFMRTGSIFLHSGGLAPNATVSTFNLGTKDTGALSWGTNTDPNLNNTVWHQGNDGSGSGLDADFLDGVEGSSFLRSNVADNKTSGNLIFNNSIRLQFGTTPNADFRYYASNDFGLTLYSSTGDPDFVIRRDASEVFRFGGSTGNFTATGKVSANSVFSTNSIVRGFNETNISGISLDVTSANPELVFQRWTGSGTNFYGTRFKKENDNKFHLEFANQAVVASQSWVRVHSWEENGKYNIGVSGTHNGGVVVAKQDTGVMSVEWEDNYYRYRRGGGGTISGWRWDNFDDTIMQVEAGGSMSIKGGSDYNTILMKRTNSDLQIHRTGIISKHYNDAEEDVATILSFTDASSNNIHIGGATGLYNAATSISFWTAANNSTPTGTRRMIIQPSGRVSIGNTNDTYNLDVTGTGRFTSTLYADGNINLTAGTTDWSFQASANILNLRNLTTPNNLITFDGANDRIGILDTSPSYTLDVNGTGRFTGTLIASSFVKSGAAETEYLMGNGATRDSATQSLSGTTPTLNFNSGANATMTLTGNTTLTISNVPDGGSGAILVVQDSTPRTLTISTSQTEIVFGTNTAIQTVANSYNSVFYKRVNGWMFIVYGHSDYTPPL